MSSTLTVTSHGPKVDRVFVVNLDIVMLTAWGAFIGALMLNLPWGDCFTAMWKTAFIAFYTAVASAIMHHQVREADNITTTPVELSPGVTYHKPVLLPPRPQRRWWNLTRIETQWKVHNK